jgi:hypothetical protein
MLVIRNEQIKRFDASAEAEFEARLQRILQDDYPELIEEFSADKVLEWIRSALKSGRQFGLELEKDLFQMVVITFMLGEGFLAKGEHAWIRQRLEDDSIAPGVRLLQVRTRLAEEFEAD